MTNSVRRSGPPKAQLVGRLTGELDDPVQPPVGGVAAHEPDIREAVEHLRATHRPTTSTVPASQRATEASLLRRLEAAHVRNRELATEIRQLREQLARAHGQLRAARLTSAPPTGATANAP